MGGAFSERYISNLEHALKFDGEDGMPLNWISSKIVTPQVNYV